MKNLFTYLFFIFSSNAHSQTNLREITLDGVYEMKIKIGEHVFYDQLILKGKNSPINLKNFEGAIEGKIIVPNIFEAKLEGDAKCFSELNKCKFDFEITAKENGKEYKVFYKGSSQLNSSLVGTAYLSDGSVLGNFDAIRVKIEEGSL